MAEMLQANWLLLVAALLLGLLVAWWVFVRSRRTKIEPAAEAAEAPAGAARRNQALIDAPPAAATTAPIAPPAGERAQAAAAATRVIPVATPMGLAGAGDAVLATAIIEPDPADLVEPEPAAPAALMPQAAAPAAGMPEPAAPDPAPIFAPAPSAVQAAAAGPATDDLVRIKGLGPKLHAHLNALGITTIAQIAAWDEADIDRIDAQLGRFQGRIRRDDWPAQARLLTAGDVAAYEERFGKL